eukprot:TRINITY_DN14646_c0_g2_i1.p1 TRINITY_DN14646_c0_g2~~TRINITY_DN14646_c0_g2_i1.p1  ORF type:complete len:231 (+),score=34.21 TRINITY_DN14646_c0_g2_i1:66-695(+)
MNSTTATTLASVMGPLSILSMIAILVGSSQFVTPYYWHPVLMTFGYVVMMSHGVLTATRAVMLPAGEQRLQLLKKHMLIQIFANLSVIGGLVAIYQNKELKGKQHFSTPHAKFGLFTMGISFYSPLMGIFGFRFLGLTSYLSDTIVTKVKSAHRVTGSLTVIAGIMTAAYGVYLHLTGYAQYLLLITLAGAAATHAYVAVVKNQIQMLP